jgi:beta-lactamase regulating signal transducer with metallopeptidase domain
MTLHPDALGWTLIHFCWQASAIGLAYGAIDMAFRNASSRARYGLAAAALLAMVLVAAGTLIHELAAIRLATPDMVASGASDGMPIDAAGRALPYATRDSLEIAALLPWLDLLWLAGIVCLTLRALGGYYVLSRFVRATDPDVPEQLTASVRALCTRLGITSTVSLRLTHRACGPFVVGVVRAVIVVPVSALTALSPAQLEMVLAHELAHVRRADFLWNILQTIVETLFFFHPAVWWIGRRLRTEREHCCDDMALAACGDPVTYATALVRLERARPTHRLAPALDGHGSGAGLRARITRILGSEPQRPQRIAPLLVAAVGIASLLLFSPLPYASAADPVSPHARRAEWGAAPRHRPMMSMTLGTQTTVSVVDRTPARPASPSVTAPAVKSASLSATAPEPEDYAGAMRNAGYADDDRFLPSLQQDGVPPDYVRSLAAFDLGALQARQIRTLWTRGVRAADIRALQAAGAQASDWRDLVGFSLYGVTPAFITAMRAAGFDHIEPGKLIMLGKLGVTPDYARAAKQDDPSLDTWHLIHKRLVETGRWHPPGWSGTG